MLLKPLQQFVIEQGVENDTRRFLNLGQNPIELLLRPHQRIHMFDRQDLGVLRRGGPRDGGQRLAGRVGHEMKMEIAASTLRHDNGMGNL